MERKEILSREEGYKSFLESGYRQHVRSVEEYNKGIDRQEKKLEQEKKRATSVVKDLPTEEELKKQGYYLNKALLLISINQEKIFKSKIKLTLQGYLRIDGIKMKSLGCFNETFNKKKIKYQGGNQTETNIFYQKDEVIKKLKEMGIK